MRLKSEKTGIYIVTYQLADRGKFALNWSMLFSAVIVVIACCMYSCNNVYKIHVTT